MNDRPKAPYFGLLRWFVHLASRSLGGAHSRIFQVKGISEIFKDEERKRGERDDEEKKNKRWQKCVRMWKVVERQLGVFSPLF